MYLNVPFTHFRKIKFDRLRDGLEHIDIVPAIEMAHIYCFFNCKPHVVSASCRVALVSCRPPVVSASCLSASCPATPSCRCLTKKSLPGDITKSRTSPLQVSY